MKKYSYYLIDIDRTLWNFDKNSEIAIHTLILRNPFLNEAVLRKEENNKDYLHIFFEKYDVINHKLWSDYETGIIDKDNLRWKRFYDTFLIYSIDDEPFARQFGDDYLNQMICEKELMPGAADMLSRIEKSGGKMAVLSNGFKEVQYHKLERSGIRNYFSAVIISEEVGYHKPLPDIFRIALEKLCGFTQDENPEKWREAKASTLMVGDDFENDIEGAQIFGIDQYFYNHKHTDCPGATYEYDTLERVCSENS